MTYLQTMYPGVANSPNTFLKEDLTRDATVMHLADGSVLGTLPTLAVIGGGADAETVLVTSTRSDGGFTIERGVEGKQQAWKKATIVGRNWTNKDYEAIRANIEAVNDGKVDKVSGKGLSSNDYNNAAKAKVDGIPANPKYTDTIPDLSPYAKTTDIKTRLADMEEDSEHRTVTDAEKKAWSESGGGSGGIDKQYLYDILMGESLVTKKADEWPVVHGKPTTVEAGAFHKKQLTSVVIPPSVTSIGNWAFKENQLTSVVIPPSVTSIGDYAFSENQLTSVVIPSSVTSIGGSAFYKNQLISVVIPSSVTSIGGSAFYGNQLISVVIPPSVTRIESWLFNENQLTSVVIPPSVTSIGDYAFSENQLTSVVIPSSVTSIGERTFYKNQLTEVKIPENCTVKKDTFDASVNIIRY